MLDENIRIMRREKGLTQEQLAEVMGVSTASVSKWETGIAAPELTLLAALADYFEMSIDALVGHTVGKTQLKEKLDIITELSLENQDEKAIEQAEELLRRYPNEYDVIKCAANIYYAAFIHHQKKEHMYRCMEFIHRQYTLSKDTSAKKWFEMQASLANCHELLNEWKKAKTCYEESNIAGLHDSSIARCLAGMKETDSAIKKFSSAIENNVFTLISDLMSLANLWIEKNDNKKAATTYNAALEIINSFKNQTDLKMMELSCHLALACIENKSGNMEVAKAYIHRAIHADLGKGLLENNTNTFLQPEKPHKIIHTSLEGNRVIQLLTAMEEEELLTFAKKELE